MQLDITEYLKGSQNFCPPVVKLMMKGLVPDPLDIGNYKDDIKKFKGMK